MTLREKLAAGKPIYGTMVRVVRNPAICYLASNAGLDFVMYDCEHAPYSMETLHDLFLAGNALGLGGFLRVPQLEKQYISRALDQGAGGVMVPMLDTPELAQRFVHYAKYQPVGGRGLSTSGAHTGYAAGGKHSAVMAHANDTVVAIAQIETRTAVDNVDAIAATPGIDALLIGPNDLSVSLGVPGDLFHPTELEAIAHVAAACRKHGKAFGLHAGEKLLRRFQDDLTLVMTRTDADFLADGLAGIAGMLEG